MFKISKLPIPLLLQVSVLTSYSIVAREFFYFERPHSTTFFIIIFTVLFDYLLGRFYFKKNRFPYSSLITGFACSLLIDSHYAIIYFFAAILSILSKAYLRYGNRHIFNPANFGVCVVLIFIPELTTGMPQLFASDQTAFIIFLIIGLIVSYKAKVLDTSLSFIFFFLFFGLVRSGFETYGLYFAAQLTTSPAMLLYIFHMITDPMTTPKSRKLRFGWGFGLAFIDSIFRQMEIPYGNFYAQFILSLSFPFVLKYEDAVTTNKYKFYQSKYVGIFVVVLLSILFLVNTAFKKSRGENFSINKMLLLQKIGNNIEFEDKTKDAHINFIHDEHVSKSNQSRFYFISPGITVGDINNDGFQDFFVVNSHIKSENHLYINQGNGKFQNEAIKWGVNKVSGMNIAPTFFDFDNDGDLDLFISQFGCSEFYLNVGDKFINKTVEVLKGCKNGNFGLPFDFNNDGLLDILLISYIDYFDKYDPIIKFLYKAPKYNYEQFEKDIIYKRIFNKKTVNIGMAKYPLSLYNANNGGKNIVLINQKGVDFNSNENNFNLNETRFSFDTSIVDIDNDGILELIIANDFGPDHFFKINVNKKKLENISKKLIIPDRRNGMNVSVNYNPGNNIPELYISNIYLDKYEQRGNFLYKYESNGLKDIAREKSLYKCGWAWGGNFSDFNNDGYNDLYVANGFISSKMSKNKSNDNFLMASLKTLPDFMLYERDKSENESDPFSLAVNLKNKSFAGFQEDCLFLYDPKKKKYINIRNQVNMKGKWDGRAAATIDYDNDGDLDLIVTAQANYLHFFENKLNLNKNWVGFEFEGKESNRDGVGAQVWIYQGKTMYKRIHLAGKTGFLSMSDRRMHLGLKNNKSVNLKIIWPSGVVQKINNINTGKYHKIAESKAKL
jgi:enediyne biosynthesis protein E4